METTRQLAKPAFMLGILEDSVSYLDFRRVHLSPEDKGRRSLQ